MLPICIVNAETLAQVPDDVRFYLRALGRRIIELEQADRQPRPSGTTRRRPGLACPAAGTNPATPTTARRRQGQTEHQLQQLLPTSILGPLSRQTSAAPSSWPAPQQTPRATGPPPPPAPVGPRRSGPANHSMCALHLSPLWPSPEWDRPHPLASSGG